MRAAAAAPWLDPADGSVWVASGTYPNGRGTFTDCVLVAVPRYATGGPPLFVMHPPLSEHIDPAAITRATPLLLVLADSPRVAFYADEQQHLDRALEAS